MNGSQTYEDRQAIGVNQGEELFMQWCYAKGWKFNRIGFDEKQSNVAMFYKLNPMLRNIPDFVINREEKMFVVNVKGTANIKRTEISMLPLIVEAFGSNEAPLVYAFCFANEEPKFVPYYKVIEMYDKEQDKQWHDGKIYRTLTF